MSAPSGDRQFDWLMHAPATAAEQVTVRVGAAVIEGTRKEVLSQVAMLLGEDEPNNHGGDRRNGHVSATLSRYERLRARVAALEAEGLTRTAAVRQTGKELGASDSTVWRALKGA